MAVRKPTPQTRAFGTEVARLREEAGLTRPQLALATSVTRSYIAQVENGTTRCRQDFAARIDTALKTTPTLADVWAKFLRSAKYPQFFVDYSRAEASSTLLRAYDATYVYGLFQTEDYIRSLLHSDEAVAARLSRQKSVLERSSSPAIAMVLNEVVLMCSVGGVQVMRDQISHLLEVSTRDNVVLQVAPIASYRGVSGSFYIATQPDAGDLLHQETSTGGVTSSDPHEVLRLETAFVMLQAEALSADASRDHLRKVLDQRWK